ncbi:hypothetical protein HRbin07_00271 [bacterium HR07]|uniref:Hypothetical conserved protein n=2 Tax=Candidatus Bipolaricaulota TaxID=67810 RepID=H5SFA0_9BACT|nr:hypothetical conserved protein [uncultured Acetothermia bacterium]BAL58584.1 hypothetical conserved protein [Candidatus Acetothermum autotrophicum]GBC76075.1 hypothetical protein HRbin07_00271 [bacterium HR07]
MKQRLDAIRAFWRTVNRYLTWGDYLVIALVLLGASATIPLLHQTAEASGRWAIVRLDGQVVHQLSLAHDQEVTVTGPAGETVIQIQGGRIRVLRSPGPQQICVRQGWIHKPGEALICLPNHVTIEIPGSSGIDAISR